jgi:hybrid polyketide synthase/nonribosomal peptide synthetase ACE1
MVQAFFDYRQGMLKKQPMGNCQLELLSFQGSKVPYDIALDIIDDAGEGDCVVHLLVRNDLYTEEQAQVLVKCLVKLAESFSRIPNTALNSAAMFDAQEIESALDLSQGEHIPNARRCCCFPDLSNDLCNTDICARQLRKNTGHTIRNDPWSGKSLCED